MLRRQLALRGVGEQSGQKAVEPGALFRRKRSSFRNERDLRHGTKFVPNARLPGTGACAAETTQPQPNRAKRLECAELAPALEGAKRLKSGSRLHVLQTLRAIRMSLSAGRSSVSAWRWYVCVCITISPI